MQFTVVKLLHLEQITCTDYLRALATTERNNTQMTLNSGSSKNARCSVREVSSAGTAVGMGL